MYKTYVKNEQRWIRNRVIYDRVSLFLSNIEKATEYINIYKNVANDIEEYKNSDKYDIYYKINNMIKIAQHCRRYLLEKGNIKQLNSAIKQIKDSSVFWFFRSTFNPYCGAYEIIEQKMKVEERGISKKLSDSKYLYYDPLAHDLCYYSSKSKSFIPTRRFHDHKYLEKCRKNVNLNITWEIIDLR